MNAIIYFDGANLNTQHREEGGEEIRKTIKKKRKNGRVENPRLVKTLFSEINQDK